MVEFRKYAFEFYDILNLIKPPFTCLLFTSDAYIQVYVRLHFSWKQTYVLLDFLLTVKGAPHECVIRTSQP